MVGRLKSLAGVVRKLLIVQLRVAGAYPAWFIYCKGERGLLLATVPWVLINEPFVY